MKQIDANKSLFDNILGLSCIENYVLYIFATQNCDYRFLYAQSVIPFHDIAIAICNEAIPYAYFNKILRIQDVACKEGLISLTYVENLDSGVSQYDYCCIKVTPDFVKERYKRDLWRNDHYILLCNQSQSTWTCLNDNPRDVFKINNKELYNAYGEQAVGVNMLANLEDKLKNKLLNEFKYIIAKQHRIYEFSFNNIENARDVLGVLRITRKRIYEYCSIYFNADFIMGYLIEIDKSYAALEYMRLRKKIDFEKIRQMLKQIQIKDLEMMDLLKKKMEMVI